jgi:hypothetical protein
LVLRHHPITRASGARQVILARHARNKRLADAIYLWAFAALNASPGARIFFTTTAAPSATPTTRPCAPSATTSWGFLHGCLGTRTLYDEHTAWAHRASKQITQAA